MTSQTVSPAAVIIGDDVSTNASVGELEMASMTSAPSMLSMTTHKDPDAKPNSVSGAETIDSAGFNAGLFWKNPRTKSLLCRDHLTRGNDGGVSGWSKLFFLITEVAVHFLQYWVLKRGGGELFWRACSYYVLGETESSSKWADYHVPEWQANVVIVASLLYTLKVMRWNFCVSHSDTVGVGSALFVGYYHVWAHISVSLACFRSWFAVLPDDDAATAAKKEAFAYFWAFLGMAMCAGSLFLEAIADQQLADFKAKKSSNKGNPDGELERGADEKRVCDVGMWGWCRHPNYVWNVFPFASIGLISGWLPMFAVWVFIQVFWAYTQSGPNHEIYMAKRYGAEWDEYKKRVPMLIPKVIIWVGSGHLHW
jgi:hypothetical protein